MVLQNVLQLLFLCHSLQHLDAALATIAPTSTSKKSKVLLPERNFYWIVSTYSYKNLNSCLFYPECSAGWTPFSGRCYRHYAETKSWTSARLHCQTSAPGSGASAGRHARSVGEVRGELASIPDQATNDFLAELHSASAAWVGGTDAVAEGSPDGGWIWTDGTPWHYTSWAPGQPNHKHGQDYLKFSDGSWNDLKNSNKRTFFCQYTGETEISIFLIPDSRYESILHYS